MKALHQTSFVESLMIQVRVVGALLMREIITRYGRNNIGFLWLFVEPLLLTLVIVLLWKFLRADRVSSLNIIAVCDHRLSDGDDVAQCVESGDWCNCGQC